jgi:hypothetical protein
MRPLSVLTRQGICAIAGDEQERDVAMGEGVRDRIDPLPGQIYVQHCGVIVFVVHRIKRSPDSRYRALTMQPADSNISSINIATRYSSSTTNTLTPLSAADIARTVLFVYS